MAIYKSTNFKLVDTLMKEKSEMRSGKYSEIPCNIKRIKREFNLHRERYGKIKRE